ncbi:bud emergence protein 1 [Allomyces javanicus]|nr:bud emergence protein 1 [Allomyces javanicus]
MPAPATLLGAGTGGAPPDISVDERAPGVFSLAVSGSLPLVRTYDDLVALHAALLLAFPDESGRTGRMPRSLPFLPDLPSHRDPVTEHRLRKGVEYYVLDLLALPPNISRHPAVTDFLDPARAPAPGTYAIPSTAATGAATVGPPTILAPAAEGNAYPPPPPSAFSPSGGLPPSPYVQQQPYAMGGNNGSVSPLPALAPPAPQLVVQPPTNPRPDLAVPASLHPAEPASPRSFPPPRSVPTSPVRVYPGPRRPDASLGYHDDDDDGGRSHVSAQTAPPLGQQQNRNDVWAPPPRQTMPVMPHVPVSTELSHDVWTPPPRQVVRLPRTVDPRSTMASSAVSSAVPIKAPPPRPRRPVTADLDAAPAVPGADPPRPPRVLPSSDPASALVHVPPVSPSAESLAPPASSAPLSALPSPIPSPLPSPIPPFANAVPASAPAPAPAPARAPPASVKVTFTDDKLHISSAVRMPPADLTIPLLVAAAEHALESAYAQVSSRLAEALEAARVNGDAAKVAQIEAMHVPGMPRAFAMVWRDPKDRQIKVNGRTVPVVQKFAMRDGKVTIHLVY